MKTKTTLFGLLAVFAAGAVTGALLTSEKGSGARKKVTKKGRELAEALSREIEEKVQMVVGDLTGQQPKNNKDSVAAKSERVG